MNKDSSSIDDLLKHLKRAKEPEDRQRIFCNFLSCIKKEELKIDLTGRRGDPVDFARVAGSKDKELAFRDCLLWLRTIPLSEDSCFIALRAESGVYRKDKKEQYSADLLGLHRNSETTMFAVAELKYGRNKDHLFYAIAQGLRNLCLHLQGLKPRLYAGWKITEDVTRKDVTRNAWGKKNPFGKLTPKSVSLLIIGDDSWIGKQKELLKPLSLDPINLGASSVKIAIYSSKKGWSAKGKPYALLPLKKYYESHHPSRRS